MLPCIILLQEHEQGGVEVTAVNPMQIMSAVGNTKLTALAEEESQKFKVPKLLPLMVPFLYNPFELISRCQNNLFIKLCDYKAGVVSYA